jgi:DNA (cytosine-5)-methyltransferase 1
MAKRGGIIDLFCGAGGMSLGAHMAGFDTIAAVDIDRTLTSAFQQNFPNSRLLIQDIARLSAKSLQAKAALECTEIVGIVGGPPCQGFSFIGKRDYSDPRNTLLQHFFRLVKDIKPAFFVMENVPGLIQGNSKGVLTDLIASTKGYEIVGPLIVDAHRYGAPTHRKRVVVIGYDGNRMSKITESKLLSARSARWSTVRDAISDIPEPTESEWARYRTVSDLASYAKRARRMPSKQLGASDYRIRVMEGEVCGLQPTLHSAEVIKRFGTIKPGTTDLVSRCPRLEWDSAAPTLRAGTGPDKGRFQSIRPIHPESDRVITVREAARLQGFPDWFKFHPTKWHSFRMIGNSVSPLMAKAILEIIGKAMHR